MINLYTWDGTFDPADFGKALRWIYNISEKFWQNVSSDFFIYFIICVFVLPPVIYVIGSYIIDMVNYKPSFEKIYYDNGRGLYSSNNTVYGNIVKYSKFKKNKKVEQPPYDIIKEKVVDEYGNVTEMKYKNGKFVGSTSYVDNQPPYHKESQIYKDNGNTVYLDYDKGKYKGSRTYEVNSSKEFEKNVDNGSNVDSKLNIEYDDES